MLSCIKNEQVREELLKNLEDFKKLVKKRGSFGACLLPDAFGRIVCFKNYYDNNQDRKSCIFATNDYCYYILYQAIHVEPFQPFQCEEPESEPEPEPSNIWGGNNRSYYDL